MPLDPIEIVGGLAIGEGLGGAIADTVEPRLQAFKNDQWSKHTDVPLDPAEAARVAAEEYAALADMASEAALSGYNAQRFQHLYDVTVTAPGMGELLTMLRRQTIAGDDFAHGLRKAQREPRWDAALHNLAEEWLTPELLAIMVQRGIVPNDGLLPVGPPTGTGLVPPMPMVAIDPIVEAAGGGISRERLAAMARIIGLPASPDLAARMTFRQIIERVDFDRAISEGNTRNEWAPFLLEGFREILTADQYVEAHLRGWTDEAAMYAGTAKHGMSAEDTLLKFKTQGRPISVHQITTGLARGGSYPSAYTDVPEPYRKAIQESNIRPEWASLDYANRYTYPSPFVMRSLAEAGDLGDAKHVKQLLLEIGWPPALADSVSLKWVPSGTVADPHVKKAQGQLYTTAHKSYVDGNTTDAQAQTDLAAAGVAASGVQGVLALWRQERSIVRRSLSPSQIKKAIGQPGLDQAWALGRLQELGYTLADATAFLGE